MVVVRMILMKCDDNNADDEDDVCDDSFNTGENDGDVCTILSMSKMKRKRVADLLGEVSGFCVPGHKLFMVLMKVMMRM